MQLKFFENKYAYNLKAKQDDELNTSQASDEVDGNGVYENECVVEAQATRSDDKVSDASLKAESKSSEGEEFEASYVNAGNNSKEC